MAFLVASAAASASRMAGFRLVLAAGFAVALTVASRVALRTDLRSIPRAISAQPMKASPGQPDMTDHAGPAGQP
jgi:hypothetical protein